jgi:hypothetical protein
MSTAGRRSVSYLVAALIVLAPLSARADVGIPVGALFWPATWVLFLPVAVIEALVARRILGLDFSGSLKLSLKANAWSTVAGVPLACILMFVVGLFASAGSHGLRSAPWLAQLFFGSAVWLDGLPDWAFFAGPTLICIPCYFLSVWIETWSAAKTVPRSEARRWAKVANGITYGLFVASLLSAAVVYGNRQARLRASYQPNAAGGPAATGSQDGAELQCR